MHSNDWIASIKNRLRIIMRAIGMTIKNKSIENLKEMRTDIEVNGVDGEGW